jgi:DNA-binding winged helix-turn-helix (wHTH) protein
MNTEVKHFESLYPVETREQELGQLVNFVREGNSSQIVSLPGVGRSNILGLLAYNRAVREKHFPTKNAFVHFVLVNFSEVADRPLIDATKLMFLNLVDSLREREMLEEHAVASEIFRESLSYQDELVLFKGLKRVVEYLAVGKKLTIIFLFDRFEEYVPMLDHAFFSNLRILRNIAKYRFSVVFTLFKPLEDILEASLLADFYEFVAGHVVYLRLYDEPSVSFRLAYLEQLTGKTIPDARKAELLELTGGHWKLTRAGAEAILANDVIMSPSTSLRVNFSEESHTKDPSAKPQDDWLQSFLLQQKTVTGALREILFTLTPEEQKYLQDLVIPGLTGNPDSRIRENDKSEYERVNEYFKKIGLVKEGNITIPLLSAYISLEQAAKQTEKQPIVFDEEKNVIRKGETVLSDSLTAAEFRLLAYLLRHPERVIEREELLAVVWQDAKTTAGVTDQAIDQLIFRLRRKIEENPNQPTHLVTVKGRGFSFTP